MGAGWDIATALLQISTPDLEEANKRGRSYTFVDQDCVILADIEEANLELLSDQRCRDNRETQDERFHGDVDVDGDAARVSPPFDAKKNHSQRRDSGERRPNDCGQD